MNIFKKLFWPFRRRHLIKKYGENGKTLFAKNITTDAEVQNDVDAEFVLKYYPSEDKYMLYIEPFKVLNMREYGEFLHKALNIFSDYMEERKLKGICDIEFYMPALTFIDDDLQRLYSKFKVYTTGIITVFS